MRDRHLCVWMTLLALLLFALPLYAKTPAKKEQIKFVYFEQFEPFSWKANGQMKGLFIETVDRICQDLGMAAVHEGYPWKRAQFMVQYGKADGMCTIATKARIAYALPVDPPVIRMAFRLFTAADHPRLDTLKAVRTLDDLKGFRLVDILGSGWAQAHLSHLNLSFEPSYPAIFKTLSTHLYDAAIRNNFQTAYLINKFGYKHKLIQLPQSLLPAPKSYRILISKKSKYAPLLPRINQIMDRLARNGTLAQMQQPYL